MERRTRLFKKGSDVMTYKAFIGDNLLNEDNISFVSIGNLTMREALALQKLVLAKGNGLEVMIRKEGE